MKSFLQTKEWADFKCQFDWRSFWVKENIILGRNLVLGKSMLYCPELNFSTWQDQNEEFMAAVRELAKKEKAIFLRLEFLNKKDPEKEDFLKKLHFKKAFEEIQPENRVWIDLTPSHEEILAQMKSKGRYNIKIAQKHGIKIESFENPTSEQTEEFYGLYHQTAKRNKFSFRGRKYFQELSKLPYVKLYLAKHQGETLAASFIVFYEDMASYLYGASSSEKRNLMAPYLMHWQIMQDAKQAECKIYDLLAIAPEGDEKHRFTNLTRFKEQFGREKVQLMGSWDLIFQPFWYKLYRWGEGVRRK